MAVYYLGRGVDAYGNDIATPFPEGFKMFSGNNNARSYDSQTMTWGNATYPPTQVANRVTFACLNYANEPPTANNMSSTNWYRPTSCLQISDLITLLLVRMASEHKLNSKGMLLIYQDYSSIKDNRESSCWDGKNLFLVSAFYVINVSSAAYLNSDNNHVGGSIACRLPL